MASSDGGIRLGSYGDGRTDLVLDLDVRSDMFDDLEGEVWESGLHAVGRDDPIVSA
jgi:hypothetical protein